MCMMRREVFMDFYYDDMALIFQWVCGEILHVFSFLPYSLIYLFRFWDGVIQEFHVPLACKACYPLKSPKP